MLNTFDAKSKSEWAKWLKLDTFGDPALLAMVCACATWARAFQARRAPRWVSLVGNSGTGKTHCGKSLFAWARAKSDFSQCAYNPLVVYWPAFVQDLRAGIAFDIRRDMQKWPVLFLDDIGAERDTSGFASEELNTLLGCRVGKWTILTSNATMERLEAIDGRLASRLVRDGNILCSVNTKDYALRGEK